MPAHTGCYRLPALTRNGWPSEIYFVSLGLLEAGALVAAARHGEALDHVLPGRTCGTMPPPSPLRCEPAVGYTACIASTSRCRIVTEWVNTIACLRAHAELPEVETVHPCVFGRLRILQRAPGEHQSITRFHAHIFQLHDSAGVRTHRTMEGCGVKAKVEDV